MVQVEHLSGLRHRREQRVVAAQPLLPLVEADGGALGGALRARHRAAEVERHPRQPERRGAVQDQPPVQAAHVVHATSVGPRRHPAHRRDLGQMPHARRAPDHLVVPVVPRLAQLPEAHPEMHDEEQRDHVRRVDRTARQVAEASAQAFLRPQPREQALVQHQPGVRRQQLVLETNFDAVRRFTPDAGLATLHPGGLLSDQFVEEPYRNKGHRLPNGFPQSDELSKCENAIHAGTGTPVNGTPGALRRTSRNSAGARRTASKYESFACARPGNRRGIPTGPPQPSRLRRGGNRRVHPRANRAGSRRKNLQRKSLGSQ